MNTKHVDNNAYITIGDPYHDPKANMFRQDDPKAKKTSDKPFGSKVSEYLAYSLYCLRLLSFAYIALFLFYFAVATYECREW